MSRVRSELRSRDVMTADPVCVAPTLHIRELAKVFEQHEISGVPVVDHEGKVIGVVSKSDLVRRCAEGTSDIPPAYFFEMLAELGTEDDTSEVLPEPLLCVEDFMTEDPLMIGPDLSAAAAASLMSEHRVHRVIVVDDEGFPLGIITSMDMLSALSRAPNRGPRSG